MIEFTVLGIPISQGSMRSFVPKTCHYCGGGRRASVTSDNPRLKQWRKTVQAEAIRAIGFDSPYPPNIPIRLEATFYLPRAKSNKALDATKKPDLSKLLRAIEDSMTKVLYNDDAQIVEIHVFKAYSTEPRVTIRVEEATLLAVPVSIERNAVVNNA